jgi:outer membrane immunogenic protein
MKYTAATIGAFAGAALLSSAALAADLYSPPPVYEPVAVVPAFSWTGFYLGVMGGYGGDKFEYPFNYNDGISVNGQADITSSGFFGGGTVGFNYQFNNWVAGVEGDIAWSGIKGELGANVGPLDLSAGSEIDWFGTIRARLGFLATERFMIYGTGGAAYGETNSYANLNLGGPGLNVSQSDTNWGWTAGGGFEYAITDHLTFKTEYLYVDLGSQELLGFGGGGSNFSLDVDSHFHTVKAGLNWLW